MIGVSRIVTQQDLDVIRVLTTQALQRLLDNVDALEKDIVSQM